MGFSDFYNSATIKVSWPVRIIIIVFILTGVIYALIPKESDEVPVEQVEEDTNTYLYEEVRYADEIFINCIGINAVDNDDGTYTLNLKVKIEQWNTDFNINQQEISPEMFEIRLVDIYAPSAMSVFMGSLAKATLVAAASAAIGGEINVIDQTLGFAEDYITESIENASSSEDNTLKANSEDFVSFNPYRKNGVPTYVDLSFIITDDYLNSHKIMVLSIDTFFTLQKNIFLTLRPGTKDYNVQFDYNGGTSLEETDNILIESGKIEDFPSLEPIKEGYKFAFWTTEKDNPETRLRDLYFYTYEDNKTFTVYAYYEESIPLEDYVNLGENIEFKDSTYLISILDYEILDSVTIIDALEEEIEYTPGQGKTILAISLEINKTAVGDNHILDNDDDFHLKNEYPGEDLSSYYGYINIFDTIKPIDDYRWIGMEIDDIGTYQIILYFEIGDHLSVENLYVLEIDFFWGPNSKHILVK